MLGKVFYHGLIEKYVVLFGTLFNDIWINRTDDDNNTLSSQKVPLTFSPREKLLARIRGAEVDRDPLKQPFAISLPRMGFEITGYEYDASRKLTSFNHFAKSNATDLKKRKSVYMPVPYNITFELSILAKNTSDGTRIIEQILPYFKPEWNVSAELISDPRIVLDIPIILNSVSSEDVYEGSFEERRSLVWILSFTMKVYFFGPVREQSVIKLANTNLYTNLFNLNDTENASGTRITVTPGLDANGNPTTDANTTIDRSLIRATDSYDFIVDISDFS